MPEEHVAGIPPALASRPDVHVRAAHSADERRRIRLEVANRAWARSGGIPVPAVVAAHPAGDWLVSERAVTDAAQGARFVELGLEVAARIGGLVPPEPAEPASTWHAPRRTVPLRLARLARWGVSPRVFLARRAQAAALPRTVAVHGDLHEGNLAYDRARDRVLVIDWEHAGLGPRFGDALRLVTTLEEDADRRYGLELVLVAAERADRPAVAVLLRWLALRHFADHASRPVAEHGRDRVLALRRQWRWAEEQARSIARK